MLFARLGQLPLRDPDEGRNSEVAREMKLSGSWLIPSYNGLVYLDKPAFFFKAVALSFALFGESEATARLPSAMFAAALLVMLFAFCRREYDLRTALFAVIVVATTPLFFALGRHVIFDMTLGFFVCAAVFSGYLAEAVEGPARSRWYLCGAVAAGCATLVKGPIGFILPTLVLTCHNLWSGHTGWWKRYFHPLNLIVFFGVTLPWFFGVSRIRPDFPHYGLVEESFHRFTTTSFRRSAPFYYYALVIVGGFYAWSLLAPGAAILAWKRRFQLLPADRLFVVWIISVVLFFSISKSKLPAYILTALVALGALTARLLVAALDRKEGQAARVLFRGVVGVGILSVAVALFLSLEVFHPGSHRQWFKIRSSEYERITLIFGPAAACFAVIALLAFASRGLRNVRLALATFLVLPVAVVTAGFGPLQDYSDASSTRPLARRLAELPAGTEIVCVESFPSGLDFYLKRQVPVVSADGSELTSNYIIYTLKKTTNWPEIIVPVADRDRWLAARTNRVCLIAGKGSRHKLEALAAERKLPLEELTRGWWAVQLPPAK